MIAIILLASSLGQAAIHKDAAIAAWHARHERFSTVEFVAEGEAVTTPDVIIGLGVPTRELPDRPYPLKLHAKYDFKNRRAWVRREKFQWSVPAKSFQPLVTETTAVDGKSRVVLQRPGSGKTSSRVFDKEDHAAPIHSSDTLPFWLNSGMLALEAPLYELPTDAAMQSAWAAVPDDYDKTARQSHLILA